MAKQTVSGWFSPTSPRVPKDHDQLWKLVDVYSRWAGEKPSRQYWATLVEESRPLPQSAGRALGRPIPEWDPFDLEVHRSIDAGAADAGLQPLPTYIARPHDESLRGAVASAERGSSSIAVLVGESSTGKTRACWEAVRALPMPWRLWHPIEPDRPAALLAALDSGVPPHTVIWLNEIQFYLLPSAGERVAAGLRELLRSPASGPVLVLGTTWPDHWWRLTRQPPPNESDPHAQARQLLDGTDIAVPDSFDAAAMHSLRIASREDPRLATAAQQSQSSSGKVTQFLSGAPNLVERYRNAPRPARAVLDAAVDLRRFDHPVQIPEDLLRRAAASYFSAEEFDILPEDWFEQALDVVCSPARGLPGPLTRARQRPETTGERPAKFRVADFLEQQAREERKNLFPPGALFHSVYTWTDEPEVLHAVAARLHDVGRHRMAALLHHRALTLGHRQSAWPLAELLEMAEDVSGATSILESEAPRRAQQVLDQLARLLARQKRFDDLRALAAVAFDAGTVRLLLAAKREIESNERLSYFDDFFLPLIVRPNSSDDDIRANMQIFHEGAENYTADGNERVRRLKELIETMDPALDVRRKAIEDLDIAVQEAEKAEEKTFARAMMVAALNAEIIGIEKVVGFCGRHGLAEQADAIRRFGVDEDGLPAESWDLELLKAGWLEP
ncbi:hypothetical protein [Amycolatopsis sp. Hca4]|uniref:hypothetical protein n=1 Tax=Amycolatopsis sp. Hca4 TaxID=2742131 RepID=UPI001590D503|nr:hypothetical protein [Amycolatopsis sp. Hca4]QKV74715.1 hypothetical protein HUT10_13745 [Amycolatopsis sp. Hca4]